MTPPRAVIFDLGKVLLDFDYDIAVGRLVPGAELEAESLRTFLFSDSLLSAYESGRLSSEAFFERMRTVAGIRLDYPQFREAFGDIFVPITPMIEAQAELRRNRVPTFILSNTNEIAVCHIGRRYPFFANFDGYVLSYEVGALKPDAPIYEVVELRTGCRGGELFYLDDRQENVDAAERRGWRAVVHADPAASIRALRECGLLA